MLPSHPQRVVHGTDRPTPDSFRNLFPLWWPRLVLGAAWALLLALPAHGATVSGDITIPTFDGGYRPAITNSSAAKVRVEGTGLEANVVATSKYTGTFTR
jgi:hypothetical protein